MLPPVFFVKSSRNPCNPFDSKAVELNSRPNFLASFCASAVGLRTLAITCLKPVMEIEVVAPVLVRAAVAANSSSNSTPASAAIGATLPIEFDNSPMVVLPAFIATNIASDISVTVPDSSP